MCIRDRLNGASVWNTIIEIELYGSSVLATNQNDLQSTVRLYPNPVKDVLYISDTENVSKLEVYDITGRMIKSVATRYNKVDLSELRTGNYFLKIYYPNKTINSKIIKE